MSILMRRLYLAFSLLILTQMLSAQFRGYGISAGSHYLVAMYPDPVDFQSKFTFSYQIRTSFYWQLTEFVDFSTGLEFINRDPVTCVISFNTERDKPDYQGTTDSYSLILPAEFEGRFGKKRRFSWLTGVYGEFYIKNVVYGLYSSSGYESRNVDMGVTAGLNYQFITRPGKAIGIYANTNYAFISRVGFPDEPLRYFTVKYGLYMRFLPDSSKSNLGQ